MGKVKNSLEENLLSITFFTYTTLSSFLFIEALRNVYTHYLTNGTFPPAILVNFKHILEAGWLRSGVFICGDFSFFQIHGCGNRHLLVARGL